MIIFYPTEKTCFLAIGTIGSYRIEPKCSQETSSKYRYQSKIIVVSCRPGLNKSFDQMSAPILKASLYSGWKRRRNSERIELLAASFRNETVYSSIYNYFDLVRHFVRVVRLFNQMLQQSLKFRRPIWPTQFAGIRSSCGYL